MDRSGLKAALPAAGSLLLLAALLAGGAVAEWLFALGAVLFPVGLIVLAARRLPLGSRVALALLAAVLGGSALGVVHLSRADASGERLAGLPAAAWLALVGLVLVPFVLAVWSYMRALDAEAGPPERADGPGPATRG